MRTVPDNVKSGVKHACYYEPDLNPINQELATYYGTAVLDDENGEAPRERPRVEAGVQLVERRILAPCGIKRSYPSRS